MKNKIGSVVGLLALGIVVAGTGLVGEQSSARAEAAATNAAEQARSEKRTFTNMRQLLGHYEAQGYVMLGRFESSTWPATVVYEKDAVNEVSFVLKKGGMQSYPKYDGYRLKVVAVEDAAGGETVVVFQSKDKIAVATTPPAVP